MPRDTAAQNGARDSRDRDAQTPERAQKRVKIFRACTTCVSSKTRCEDVTPAGCSLCRRRNKPCSLAAVARAYESSTREASVAATVSARSPAWQDIQHQAYSQRDQQQHSAHPTPPPAHHPTPPGQNHQHTPTTHPTPPSHHFMQHNHAPHGSPMYPTNDIEELRLRLAEAERRVERTESLLADLECRVRDQPRQIPHSQRAPRPLSAEYDNNEQGPLRLVTMQLYTLDETMFSVATTRSFPDPVGSVLSAAQAELAWHGFKARICAILPLPPFLAVSTPVPTHPFVLLAALHHVPGCLNEDQRQAIAKMVQDSLTLAMAGSASIDVVLALLILSLAPPMPDNGAPNAPTNPTAYRLASLAYSMGQGYGLEGKAEAALSRNVDLDNEAYAESLWILQLWCAISNRYCLLSLMHTTYNLPASLQATRLPVLSKDSVEACNAHLRAEAEVCEIYRPFVSRLAKMEYANAWPLVELEDLQHEWEEARSQIRTFVSGTDKPPSVQNDATCAEFTLGVRIASLTTNIPSPLREARETALQCLNRFPTSMKSMLDVSEAILPSRRLDPSSLPEYVVILLAAALVCFRRSVQFVAAAYPHTQIVEPARLDAAEAKLRSLGRAPRFLLDESNRLLESLYRSPMWPPHHQPEGPGRQAIPETIPINPGAAQIWDMFDFTLLYPEMLPMT